MRILCTNDDGIHAPGLAAVERIARTLSDDVWIVAPETDQSGVSHSLSLNDPLRLRAVRERRFAVKSVGKFMADVLGIDSPDSIKVLDDHTVRLKLRGTSPIFFKLLAMSFGLLRFVELAPVLAALACIGFLAEMSALQRTSPTTIAPIILALTTVLPIVIGRAVLGERWPHPVVTLLGFALTVLPALWFVAHSSLDAIGAPAPADRPLSHAEG